MPVDRTPPLQGGSRSRDAAPADTPLPDNGADTSDEDTPRPGGRPQIVTPDKYHLLERMTDADLRCLVQRILDVLDRRHPGTGSGRLAPRNLTGEFDERDGESEYNGSPMLVDNGTGSAPPTDKKRKNTSPTNTTVDVHVGPKKAREDVTYQKEKTSKKPVKVTTNLDRSDRVTSQGGQTEKLVAAKPPTPQSQPRDTVNTEKVPPIVLHNKGKWTMVSSQFKTRGFAFHRATNTQNGMKFHPQTEQDFRGIRKILDSGGHEYHTYQLQSEKLLNVVLRGVPCEIEEQEIYEDLVGKGFHPEGIFRMRRGNRRPMPLVLVKVPKSEKNIYDLAEVLHMLIQVESLRVSGGVGQCHRCQRFGHAQSRCTGARRCPRCALDHPPGECKIKEGEPFHCANCQGDHKATSRACPRYPRPVRLEPRNIPANSGRASGAVSYAGAVSAGGAGAGARASQPAPPPVAQPKTPKGRAPGPPSKQQQQPKTPGAAPSQPITDLPAMLAALQNLFQQIEAVADRVKFLMPNNNN